MAKKKTPPAVLPTVTMQAEVSNNINLNLNQNDLIDLAIQEHLEKLEKELEIVNAEITHNQNEIDKVESDEAEKLAAKVLKDDPDYIKFMKMLKVADIKITKEGIDKRGYRKSGPYRLCAAGDADNFIESINQYPHENFTNLAQATRSIHKYDFYKTKYTTLNIRIEEHTAYITMIYIRHVNLTPDVAKSLEARIDILEERKRELLKKKFNLQKEFYEYTFGEKKVKAKIVKASLQRSAEGQAILGMLQGATGVKLIG